jgi:hypothetical protein
LFRLLTEPQIVTDITVCPAELLPGCHPFAASVNGIQFCCPKSLTCFPRRCPVSDELFKDNDDLDVHEEYEYQEVEAADDDLEEISSDDVDSVVASLNELNEGIESENIRLTIENAIDEILHLVYTDDELVGADDDEEFLEEAA